MLQTYNLDSTDALNNSYYPFQTGCPLVIDGKVFPVESFISVKIQVDETQTAPVRLGRCTKSGEVHFVDAYGVTVAIWDISKITVVPETVPSDVQDDTVTLEQDSNQSDETQEMTPSDFQNTVLPDYLTCFLYNTNKVLVGHLVVTPYCVAFLQALSRFKDVTTTLNDFILDPSCLQQALRGHCRSFYVYPKYATADVTIVPTHYIRVTGNTSGTQITTPVSMSLYSQHDSTIDSNDESIWYLQVEGSTATYTIKDKHLLIRPSMTSNLRVRTQEHSIQFRGVSDVF